MTIARLVPHPEELRLEERIGELEVGAVGMSQ